MHAHCHITFSNAAPARPLANLLICSVHYMKFHSCCMHSMTPRNAQLGHMHSFTNLMQTQHALEPSRRAAHCSHPLIRRHPTPESPHCLCMGSQLGGCTINKQGAAPLLRYPLTGSILFSSLHQCTSPGVSMPHSAAVCDTYHTQQRTQTTHTQVIH
jgi:hypothetical protein